METGAAIVIDDLTRKYRKKTAVDGLSFDIQQGETFGILGANGAGKSTTVELIAGLRKPTSGSVRLLGLDPRRDRAKVRQVLGVQLQHAELHSALRVSELVRLFRSFYPSPRSSEEMLGMVDLESAAAVRFEHLSGGQQQRLSIALALAGRPRVLILDELTTGLDPAARRRIWATIESLKGDGVTIILVSHAMEEVERLCDRVALLAAGQVSAIATPAELTTMAGANNLDDAFVALTGEQPEELQ